MEHLRLLPGRACRLPAWRPRQRTGCGARSGPLLSRCDNRRHAVTRPTEVGRPGAARPRCRRRGSAEHAVPRHTVTPNVTPFRRHCTRTKGGTPGSITGSGSAVSRGRGRRSRRVECREPAHPTCARGCSIQEERPPPGVNPDISTWGKGGHFYFALTFVSPPTGRFFSSDGTAWVVLGDLRRHLDDPRCIVPHPDSVWQFASATPSR